MPSKAQLICQPVGADTMLCLHFKASVLSHLHIYLSLKILIICCTVLGRNKRESEPKIIKMHFNLSVCNGWSRDVQLSAVPHDSLSLANAEHLKRLLIMLCHQTICPSIAINWLRRRAFEELKTDARGKICHSFQWNAVRPQAKFVWQSKSFLLSFVNLFRLCQNTSEVIPFKF